MMGLKYNPSFVFLVLTPVIYSSTLVYAVVNCGTPTKIFLLAGQSNMVGMGSGEHMRKLMNDTKTHDEYSTY